ncbi:MAG: ParA family protein [Thiotrichales bacterium]|nr:ParA family protein [Thiotrichales bacterium]
MITIAFFNNKGGVGKTSLVYHLAWMYADLGLSAVAADIDSQANLSTMFLEEDRLEELWPDGDHPQSIMGAVSPILRGTGDISEPHVELIANNLGLVVGDLGLSRFEARLSSAWPACLDRDEAAFRIESAFYRTILKAAELRNADVALIDVGPNLGAINRSAIIAADFVVFPLAPDLFSLQGLRNLEPTLRDWRTEWRDRLDRRPADSGLPLPSAEINPADYIVMQHAVRAGRPVQAYQKWMRRIPGVYHQVVLDGMDANASSTEDDTECLSTLKHYRSLMPMAQEARKPMFHLKAADGALGGHIYAVQDCYQNFKVLATSIAAKCGVTIESAAGSRDEDTESE